MTAADLLDPVIRLRLAIAQTRDPSLRAELRAIEVSLRRQLGPSVTKRPAARALGVSVTALDRWVDAGALPAVCTPAATRRLAVETGPLLELATTVRPLRAGGRARGVIAEAVRRLGWRPRGERLIYSYDLASMPRPNESVEELRRHFRETTPADRLRELVGLNASAAPLAGTIRA